VPASYGKTELICSGAPIPAGWVWFDRTIDRAHCPGARHEALVIKDISGSPLNERVCNGSPIPPNWVWIDSATDPARCEPSPENLKVLKNLAGAPPGALQTVCKGSPIPAGWVAVNPATDVTRCGDGWRQNNLEVIRKEG
jgi:hypothetical protein